jgi:hypothetical protein
MLEFGDSAYYIDLKAFDKAITLVRKSDDLIETENKVTTNENGEIIKTEFFTKTTPKSKEIDGVKYDLLKTLIEYIIDSEEVPEDTLGADRALAQTSLGYKIMFNTLINEGIIKEKQ